jgi:hypothetical protein
MSDRLSAFAALAAALVVTCGPARAQTTFTKWDFGVIGTQAAPYNSPPASTGSGTATMLGMTNSYNAPPSPPSVASGDVILTAGTATPSFSENTWRIRGSGDNGWATFRGGAGAPQYSQGIELDTSTVGFTNIKFSFDWYSTTQGIRDLQFQYNTNINNTNGWTNFGGTSPTGTYIATSNDYYNPTTPPGPITVDLSTILLANNNANFGIRLVSAFDSTGNVANDYASAALSGGATVIYNNSSGNWRFDNLTFSGTAAVPEPSTLVLFGAAAAGLATRLRQRVVARRGAVG